MKLPPKRCVERSSLASASLRAASSLALACVLLLHPATIRAQDTNYPARDNLIPGPDCLYTQVLMVGYNACTPEQLKAWREDVFNWRDESRTRAGCNDARYRRPELQWAQSSYMQPQVMFEERYLFDPAKGAYTVDRYLDDLDKRIGSIDSVLVWHSYPNIGIDDRSAYDLIGDLPGGIPAARDSGGIASSRCACALSGDAVGPRHPLRRRLRPGRDG